MKKRMMLVLSIIMALLFIAGCSDSGAKKSSSSAGNADSKQKSEKIETEENGKRTIIVGTVGSGEPYSKLDDSGNWTGVEAELWAEVEKRLGWTVEVKQVGDLASLFGELDTGRIDVAANCFAITEERLKSYIATDPIYGDAQVIAVQPDSKYKTLEDLRGVSIGVTAGQAAQSTVEALAPDYDWEVTAYEDGNAGLQDLSLGRLTAFAHTVTAIEKVESAQKLEFRMLEEKLFGNNVGWWFADNEESAAIRDELNQVIADMLADGTLSTITTKWFYEDMTKLISDQWLTADEKQN